MQNWRLCFVVRSLIFYALYASTIHASESFVIERVLEARALASTGSYQEAREIANSVLEAAEEVFGKAHANYAYIVDDLSRYNTALGSGEEAIEFSLEALAIADIEPRITVDDKVNFGQNLASAYLIEGRITEAIESLKRALNSASENQNISIQLTVAGRLTELLIDSRRLGEARSLIEKYSDESVEILDSDDEKIVLLRLQNARLGLIQSDLELAEREIQSISSGSLLNISDYTRAQIEITKARLAFTQTQYQAATEYLDKAEDIVQLVAEDTTFLRASIEYNRGSIMLLLGDVVEAHDRFSAANQHYTTVMDHSHPASLRSMHGQALALMSMGDYEGSDAIFEAIVQAQIKEFGENSLVVSETLTQWSYGLGDRGEHLQALELSERVVGILENNQDTTEFHRILSTATIGFAQFNLRQGESAFENLILATNGFAKYRGDKSQDLVPGYLAIAELLADDENYSESEYYLSRVREILDQSEARTPGKWSRMFQLEARNARLQDDCKGALESAGMGIEIIASYHEYSSGRIGASRSSIKKDREILELLIDELFVCMAETGDSNEVLNTIFKALQIPQLQSTASAIEQLRVVDSDAFGAELEALISKRHSLNFRLSALENEQRSTLTGQGLDASNYESISEELDTVNAELVNINAQLRADFPEYGEYFLPNTYDIGSIRDYLDESSMMLLSMVTDNAIYSAAITSDAVSIKKYEMTKESVIRTVSSLRGALDVDEIVGVESFPKFDVLGAHDLYKALIGVHEQVVSGVSHIVIVADGVMQTLPFSVLLESVPENEISNLSDFSDLDYLINSYSLSYLPSAGSLVALETVSDEAGGSGDKRFIGFGDPLLEQIYTNGADGASRSGERSPIPGISDKSVADLFTKLPETADELTEISDLFGAKQSELYLGAEATETRLSSLDLTNVEILAFATHGVMADELVPYYSEPGLLMSPVTHAGKDSTDLLLTTSEIAQLNTDAELVLLSACNTAAAAVSDPNAEGLSGIARSFFFAGAKSLLVTHWYVDSLASKYTTTSMIREYLQTDGRNKAAALRSVALDFLSGEQGRNRAHPAFWAAFVLIGVE